MPNLLLEVLPMTFTGLFSLAIEFFRASPVHCVHDDSGEVISDPGSFPYGGASCSLRCSLELGPWSSIRAGSAIDINVVPAPTKLRFGACILLSIVCCIYSSMPLFAMGLNALESAKMRRWKVKGRTVRDPHSQVTSNTASHVLSAVNLKGIDSLGRKFLWVVEVLFLATLASLAIVIVGERNLFSSQLSYQTEPFVAIGT
jgi:hypothetical protein